MKKRLQLAYKTLFGLYPSDAPIIFTVQNSKKKIENINVNERQTIGGFFVG